MCDRSAVPTKDWNFLQLSATGLSVNKVVKPGRPPPPPQQCCLAMTAACLACAEGISVEDFCADPRHAGVQDCEEAAMPVPAPTLEEAVPTMAPEPQTSTGSTTSPKVIHEACCGAMMASCLACAMGMSIEDYCADPQHFGTPGCETPSTTSVPSAARQANVSARAGCEFETEPITPYFWDESCDPHGLGCFADGIHGPCRFCAEGPYASISCPVCAFSGKAPGLHYWDNTCRTDPTLPGCLADGVHPECRLCGEGEFEDVQCPASVVPTMGKCRFQNEPSTPYYWDPTCKLGIVGCWADGIHAECRWCGEGSYQNIPCPA